MEPGDHRAAGRACASNGSRAAGRGRLAGDALLDRRAHRASHAAEAGIFAGLFASDSDEIDFAALGQPAFVDSVREIVGEEPAALAPDASAAQPKLAASSVQFLEALSEVLAAEPAALAADLAVRAKRALQTILDSLDQAEPAES